MTKDYKRYKDDGFVMRNLLYLFSQQSMSKVHIRAITYEYEEDTQGRHNVWLSSPNSQVGCTLC